MYSLFHKHPFCYYPTKSTPTPPYPIMSDLAPFIAATIRDKVVLDLMEENTRLRQVIQHYNSVQITGPCGFPVYSRSQLDVDGRYDQCTDMWRVTFQQNLTCQLCNLGDVEIRRAGSMRKLIDLDNFWGFLDNDHDVVLTAGEEGFGQIEIGMRIEGLSDERWHSLARTGGKRFTECLMNGFSSEASAKASFQYILVEDLHVANTVHHNQ